MTITPFQLKISNEEYRQRANDLLKVVRDNNQSGVVLFDGDYIKYYTGFAFIPTERPMAFIMNADGERVLFVPRLEAEHAKSASSIDEVAYYIEYPHNPHPMVKLAEVMQKLGITGSVFADTDGYPWIFGYRGAPLSEVANVIVSPVREHVENQMAIKSEAEIELLRESSKWANLAHRLLQTYTQPGRTETEVERRACNEATDAMFNTLGGSYRGQSGYYSGAVAGYRGQIGRNAAIPHALANHIVFQKGDVLVTGASAPVWGYVSELERTMFLGQPVVEQRQMFDHMLNLQDLALESIKPGVKCSAIDRTVRSYYEKHDLMQYWKHHVGHCIGLRYHEGPFLDIGDDTIIQEGMVFTIEPGLYAPNLGGYRHSDTVVVRSGGLEMLTFYPRDIDSLIIPV